MRSAIAVAGLLAFSTSAAAQTSTWVDVNVGVASSAHKSFTTETSMMDIAQRAETHRARYDTPAGVSFDAGAGVMFSRLFGGAIQVARAAHDHEVEMSVRVPHPRFLASYAAASMFTDQVSSRTELGVSLSAVAALPIRHPNVSLRVYGGPTYFRLNTEGVRGIGYLHDFATMANTVAITTWRMEDVSEGGWGYHLGTDASYFFARHWGVGGFARFTRGTVTLHTDEFMLDRERELKIGGFQAGGGLRLRF